AMGRVAAAGAVLVALVVLGALPAAGTELSGVFQFMIKHECHFINSTEQVRFVKRLIYNQEQYTIFYRDLGLFVGDTPYGEKIARYWNPVPEFMERKWAEVNRHCWPNNEVFNLFSVDHRVSPPSMSISLLPSSSQPSPGCLLCSVMDFYPVRVQLR
ncbi:HB2J protein, partial [Dicrurus megarhynchus]|nr:HB2J protein [Dicrurus megarhynchus]